MDLLVIAAENASEASGGSEVMIPLLVIGGVVFVLIIIVAIMYNKLIRGRNLVKNAWAQIDVQLKRRHDLIPNLVETAKGYMKHEKQVLENVTAARSAAMKAEGTKETAEAENFLSETLKSLFAVTENYPDLKANQNMLAIQEELTSTENKISYARQRFNDTVMTYNNTIEMFPTNMVAGMFNFKTEESFEVELAEEKEVPEVKF